MKLTLYRHNLREQYKSLPIDAIQLYMLQEYVTKENIACSDFIVFREGRIEKILKHKKLSLPYRTYYDDIQRSAYNAYRTTRLNGDKEIKFTITVDIKITQDG